MSRSNLSRRAVSFIIKDGVSCDFIIDAFYQVEVSLCFQFVECFYHKVLDFVTCF